MQKLISSTQSSTSEFSLDLEESPTTSTSKDGTKKSAGGFDMDPVSLLQAGYGQS
jgi:hypothetical protein